MSDFDYDLEEASALFDSRLTDIARKISSDYDIGVDDAYRRDSGKFYIYRDKLEDGIIGEVDYEDQPGRLVSFAVALEGDVAFEALSPDTELNIRREEDQNEIYDMVQKEYEF